MTSLIFIFSVGPVKHEPIAQQTSAGYRKDKTQQHDGVAQIGRAATKNKYKTCKTSHYSHAGGECVTEKKRGGSGAEDAQKEIPQDRKSTRLNSSHVAISYA